jgi:puromycin-sensitive aminopeptidase
MSTYLVAFVIGEYDYIENKDHNGILIRVYTPLGKKELGRFALEVCENKTKNKLNKRDLKD